MTVDMKTGESEVSFSRKEQSEAPAMPEQESLRQYDYDVDVPDDIMEQAEQFTASYRARLQSWTSNHMDMASRDVAVEAAAPTLAGGYSYFDTLTVGPIQFFGNPPHRPAKVIAAGQLAFFVGVIWANPANSPGGGIPGTVALGSRTYNACFETVNLTTVTNAPGFVTPRTFPGPAPVVTVIPWFFIAADPGPVPAIFETHFAVDVSQPGQPFASLATWHFDIDFEPGFLFVPPTPPQLQHDIPARYLVHRA